MNNDNSINDSNQFVRKAAFVIMPFGKWEDIVYHQIYEEAFKTCGYQITRADDFFKPTEIMATIWACVQSSTIILADLTGRNPNVFYELGLSHAIHKPVILVTSSDDEIPFDLKAIRHIIYDKNDPCWGEKLKNAIIDSLKSKEIEKSIPLIFKNSEEDKNNDKYIINQSSIPALVIQAIKDRPSIKSLKIRAHSTTVIYNAFEDYLKRHNVEECELILRKFEKSDDANNDEQKIIYRNMANWNSQSRIKDLTIYETTESQTEYQIIINDEILIFGIYFPDSNQPSKIGYKNVLYITKQEKPEIVDEFIERFNLQKSSLQINQEFTRKK